jgi:serine/threonine protein kinase
VHRDLKLENIMLSAENPNAVRLIDFGLAVALNMENGKPVDTPLKDNAGTQAYRAPEVYNKKGYSALKVDVWAMGIVLFSLCSGFFPVQEAKEDDWRFKRLAKDQAKKVGACESIFKTYKRACPFSAALKGLVDGMLTIDPGKRLSVDGMCQTEWLNKPPASVSSGSGGPVYRGVDGDDDDMEDEFSVPDDAIPLERQRARRLDADALVDFAMTDDAAP